MEGSIRKAESKLRVAVQLMDTNSGVHLWAENYERTFDAGAVFELQDDLVPRIVSTCADSFGVLARSISDAVRGKASGQFTPYEALMRGFGYHHRLTPHGWSRIWKLARNGDLGSNRRDSGRVVGKPEVIQKRSSRK